MTSNKKRIFLLVYMLTGFLTLKNIFESFNSYKSVDIRPGPGVVHILPTPTPFNEPVNYGEMTYQEVIKLIRTPEQAQDYVDWLYSRDFEFKGEEDARHEYSFKRIHEGSCPVECAERSIAPAALLSDNGYPPLLVGLKYTKLSSHYHGHGVFIYKENGKFGSVGNRLDFNKPTYENLDEMLLDIGKRYGKRIRGYLLFDISESYPDWITREEPMRKSKRIHKILNFL